MLDSSSIKEAKQAVFLIHTIVNERYFWAYWPSLKHFEADLFPESYQITTQTAEHIRDNILLENPLARELEYSEAFKRNLYRRVKRAELPEAVQEKIRTALKHQRKTWQDDLLQVGFQLEDLKDLSHLKRRYRQLLYQHHPDYGGEDEAFLYLQKLYQRAYSYLSRAD